MKEINRTFEQRLTVNATGAYSIFSIDLTTFSELEIMVMVDTVIYDPLSPDVAIRHSVMGIYNSTSATVTALSMYQDEQTNYSQGDSEVNPLSYNQGTGALSQSVQVLNSGSRIIKAVSYVNILAF